MAGGRQGMAARLAFDGLFVVAVVAGIVTSLPLEADLGDLGSFLASGRAAAAGIDPYGCYPVGPGRAYDPNANAPFSVLVFHALAGFDPWLVSLVWRALSVAAFGVCLYLLGRAFPAAGGARRYLYATGMIGPWATLSIGQVYAFLLLLAVGALLLLRDGRQVGAGLLIGVMVAIKPNFAVWPALLLLGGYYRAALAVGLAAGALSLLPLLAYGPPVFGQWLAMVAQGEYRPLHPTNGSLVALGTRLGSPALGLGAAAGLLAVAALVAWRARPSSTALSRLALAAAVLASPISWPGYAVFAWPALLTRRWDRPQRLAGLLLMLPLPVWLLTDLNSPGLATPHFVTSGLLLLIGAMVGDHISALRRARGAPQEAQASSVAS